MFKTILNYYKMKLPILTLILSFLSIFAFSQTWQEFGSNEMKYWKLRGRFTGDNNNKDIYNGYIHEGEGDGKNLPFIYRRPLVRRDDGDFALTGDCHQLSYFTTSPIFATYDAATGNLTTGYTPLIDPRDGKDLKGGVYTTDNTLMQMGNYLAVLATEWALLNREGSSTIQTEKEIYYALKAIERLDAKGETMYPGTANSPNLNGFLARSDVDNMAQLNTTGKNYDIVKSAISCNHLEQSSCDGSSNANPKFTNAMSQDEVIGLLFGFALMRKCLPDNVSYNGMALRPKSREISNRIVNYVRTGGTTNSWVIVDPDQQKRVCRGQNALWFSYGIASTANYINGNTILHQFGHHNLYSQSLGVATWNTYKKLLALNNTSVFVGFPIPLSVQSALGINSYEPIWIPGNDCFNQPTTPNTQSCASHEGAYVVSMFLKLASTGRSAGNQPSYNPLNIINFFSNIGSTVLDPMGKQRINSISQTYKKELYELVSSFINGYNPVLSESYWRNEFNQLNCGCNCYQSINPSGYLDCQNYIASTNGNPWQPPGQWMVEDRWAFHKEYGGIGGQLKEFMGLDYMLAYNLYRLKYFAGGYNSRVRTYFNNRTFPYTSLPNPYDNNNTYQFGSHTYPIERKAVFSIESTNTQVTSSGNLVFSAGSDIKLKPGFKAKPGSVFRAIIKPYDCNPAINQLPNSSYVSWKTDSMTNEYFDGGETDTIVNIQNESDSLEQFEGDDEPIIDSNAFVVIYTNNVDTVIIGLGPNYSYDSLGNIIFTPPNKSQNPNIYNTTFDSWELFPSPCNESFNVSFTLYYDADVSIKIRNEIGQIMSNNINFEAMQRTKGKQSFKLNTNHLANGIYFCELSIDGHRQIKKFVVQH